jgi:hypothetical protein
MDGNAPYVAPSVTDVSTNTHACWTKILMGTSLRTDVDDQPQKQTDVTASPFRS